MNALAALLVERQKERLWEAYIADMAWVCASKFQKKFPVKRYSSMIVSPAKAEGRSGREILLDIKNTLKTRAEKRK